MLGSVLNTLIYIKWNYHNTPEGQIGIKIPMTENK